MNKKILLTVVIIAVVVLAWWMMSGSQDGSMEQTQISETPEITEENVSSVEADFNGLDFGDIDAEFESIDADLQAL